MGTCRCLRASIYKEPIPASSKHILLIINTLIHLPKPQDKIFTDFSYTIVSINLSHSIPFFITIISQPQTEFLSFKSLPKKKPFKNHQNAFLHHRFRSDRRLGPHDPLPAHCQRPSRDPRRCSREASRRGGSRHGGRHSRSWTGSHQGRGRRHRPRQGYQQL